MWHKRAKCVIVKGFKNRETEEKRIGIVMVRREEKKELNNHNASSSSSQK